MLACELFDVHGITVAPCGTWCRTVAMACILLLDCCFAFCDTAGSPTVNTTRMLRQSMWLRGRILSSRQVLVRQVTPNDYLETALLPVAGVGAAVEAKNQVRKQAAVLHVMSKCLCSCDALKCSFENRVRCGVLHC